MRWKQFQSDLRDGGPMLASLAVHAIGVAAVGGLLAWGALTAAPQAPTPDIAVIPAVSAQGTDALTPPALDGPLASEISIPAPNFGRAPDAWSVPDPLPASPESPAAHLGPFPTPRIDRPAIVRRVPATLSTSPAPDHHTTPSRVGPPLPGDHAFPNTRIAAGSPAPKTGAPGMGAGSAAGAPGAGGSAPDSGVLAGGVGSSALLQDGSPARPAGPTQNAQLIFTPPRPVYPRRAERYGIEGVVKIRGVVDARGDLIDVRVEVSSGDPDLDAAALDNMRLHRFKPALQDGVPVDQEVTKKFPFNIPR